MNSVKVTDIAQVYHIPTMSDVELRLQKLLAKIAEEQNYKNYQLTVEPVTSDNFTSSLYSVKITSSEREDLDLFMKVSILGDAIRKEVNADWMFDTEKFVYTKLVPIFIELQEKIPEEHKICFPKFYGGVYVIGEEIVALENLASQGYVCGYMQKCLDWEHAACAVVLLAKFHALSFAFKNKYPEEYKDLTKRRYLWGDDVKMTGFLLATIESSLKLVRKENREKVAKFCEKISIDSFREYNNYKSVAVAAHGDYKSNNMLFRRRNDKLQAICVDYQTVHAGCPATDLVYLIFLGTDQEFRRQHYSDLVDLYYSELSAAMRRLDVDPEAEYSREVFDMELKQVLPYALLIGVIFLPVVTVEAENAPRVDRSESTNDFVIPPNELFIERFNGIVDDCISMGVI